MKKGQVTIEAVEGYFALKEAELRKKIRYLKNQQNRLETKLGGIIQARIDFRRAAGLPSRLP